MLWSCGYQNCTFSVPFSVCRVSLSLPFPDCSSSWRTFSPLFCSSQSLQVQLCSWELESSAPQRTHIAPQSVPWFCGFLPSAVYIQTKKTKFNKRNCSWCLWLLKKGFQEICFENGQISSSKWITVMGFESSQAACILYLNEFQPLSFNPFIAY